MTKPLIALCGLAVASTAMAQETLSAVATTTGTIRPDGPRGGDGGDRFFNVQGTASGGGTFDSYGVARWDLSTVRDEFDTLFPGGWEVTGLALELTQDNAPFTNDGFVAVYYSTDDTADIKTALSDLFFPFFDMGSPQLELGDPNPILSFLFFETATGDIDRYDQDGGPGGRSEALELIDPIKADIENQDLLTLVFVDDTDPNVSATYRGQAPFEGREGPKLFITAEGDTTGGCRADLDGDGDLTIFDFLQFQNLFDAGDLTADFDGDGTLTIFDFLAFQNEFDAGC
ncbi:MAG: GC-type dockerin domain-anchored protein [Phycisphaerales bacterium JB060]